MNIQLVLTSLLLFGGCYIGADDQEEQVLNLQAYLPPLSKKLNNSYVPPTKQPNKVEKSNTKEYTTKFSKEKPNYVHNKPKVIDDPVPMKVDYVQPLAIDFLSNKKKPLLQGAFITGLFFNVYEAQSLEDQIVNKPATNNVVNVNEKIAESKIVNINTNNSLKSTDHNIKAENSLESKNNIKKPIEVNIVPINYFVDPIIKYKLFNSEDDIELSGSAPVVIFRPGDDITFTEDATVIDDYEHMIAEEKLKKNKKSAENKEATTTTTTTPPPSAGKETNRIKQTKTQSTNNSKRPLTPQKKNDAYSAEATGRHLTSIKESDNNYTVNGYFYEKPKIPFTF